MMSVPTPADVSRAPAATTTSPPAMSSPTARMFQPSRAVSGTEARRIVDGAGPVGSASVSSTGTTASAAVGTGAPVITRTAHPGDSGADSCPAGVSPTTVISSRRPAGATAAPARANPSICDVGADGAPDRLVCGHDFGAAGGCQIGDELGVVLWIH